MASAISGLTGSCFDKRNKFGYPYAHQARGGRAMASRKYWVGFNIVPSIGPAKVRALLDRFGDLETAWHADGPSLQDAGLDRKAISNLRQARAELDLDAQMADIEQRGLRVLTWEDTAYPPLLREIYGPPPVLYLRGTLLPEDQWAVAIVGTRRATAYGKQAARMLAHDLAQNGVTVVSGLARGIDAEAHQGALEAGGRTIAVMGCGLDRVYPPEHRHLAHRIAEHGALVGDYPVGTPPDARNFPPRNRIISGLSKGVLVVEAGAKSGALITVEFAGEQGRDVFAVPGNIVSRNSIGCNRLIQNGAKMVLGVQDILEELNMTMIEQQAEVRATVPTNETEAHLLELVSDQPLHVDEICRQSKLPVHQVSSTLAMMELKGLVRQVGGMQYVVAREQRVPYQIG
jgi:DNA processing protein